MKHLRFMFISRAIAGSMRDIEAFFSRTLGGRSGPEGPSARPI